MILQHALHYAAHGWLVFPAPIGTKKSHIKARDGQERWGATRDPDVLRQYWQTWPNANIGIPTGVTSGTWVLDIDTPEGHDADGFASLNAILMRHGPLPETLTAESPSGSQHLYFNYPSDYDVRNSDSVIGPGLDVRGEGGMVIAPPSVKPDGSAYRWVNNLPAADAPGWLLEMVKHVPAPPVAPRDTPASLAEIEELLSWIDPDAGGYDGWYEIIAAINDVTGASDDGLALADKWSSRGKKYNAGEVADKWRSFKPGGGLSIGTIAEYAKRAGADVRAIGINHRLMSAFQGMPDVAALPEPVGEPPAPADPVTLIMQRVNDNPHEAVPLVAGEVARLSPVDRSRVFDQCKQYGVKQIMQDAVKAALAAYRAEQGKQTAVANATGPFAPYFIVENEGGQAVVMDCRGGMEPQSRAAFRDAKGSLPPVPTATGSRPAVDVWWESDDAPRYQATGYNPQAGVEYMDPHQRRIRNVYTTGHETPPQNITDPAHIEPFMHVIRANFPDPGDQYILLQCLGHMTQRPGVLIRWAPVMQGTPGCGKGTIAEAVTYAHGRENTSHPSPDVIARDFNDYMFRKTLVVVNEIGDHTKRELSALAEKLKPWVTDSPVHIEPKGRRGFDTPNTTNWIFTTNHLHCMLATLGERRYAHFISALQTEADAARAFPGDWWARYYDWWEGGGAEAVRGFLSHMALEEAPSVAPVTTSTVQAMREGDGAALGLIREAIEQNVPGFKGGWVSVNAIRDIMASEDIRVPAGPFLRKQMEQLGYTQVFRTPTTPAEDMRFPKATRRTTVYHTGARQGLDPSQMMVLYDAAQAADEGQKRGGVVRMPGT